MTEVSANRSQLTQLLPRIALFTDAFQDVLTSTPVTARRSGASAAASGRSAALRGAAAEAVTATAAAPRDYTTPANVGDLLAGFELVDGGGDDGEAGDGEGRTALDEGPHQHSAPASCP